MGKVISKLVTFEDVGAILYASKVMSLWPPAYVIMSKKKWYVNTFHTY